MDKIIRKISLIALIIVMLSQSILIFADEGKIKFTDIESDKWYSFYVEELHSREIIGGYPDGSYKPEISIRIIEIITLIDNVMEYDINNDSSGYWGLPYIEAAILNDVVAADYFDDYERNITRGEVIYLLVNILDIEDIEVESYGDLITDFDTLTEEEKIVAAKIYSTGILSGYPDGSIRMDSEITRAEAAVVIYKMIEYIEKIDEEEVPSLEVTASEARK